MGPAGLFALAAVDFGSDPSVSLLNVHATRLWLTEILEACINKYCALMRNYR